jgi:hypothetical protein
MSESMQHEQLEMARRRHQIRQSRVLRQEAVCDFPLRVVQIAMDMRKLLTLADQFGPTPETTEALAMMESEIRKEYRRRFGEDMAGEQEFKNGN